MLSNLAITGQPEMTAEMTPVGIAIEVLHDLGREIIEINRANGWNVLEPDQWQTREYKIPAVLALIHSEVSEALEAYRHDDKENFLEEMADVIIRALDVTHGLGLDIGSAIFAKLKKNRTRGYRHGGKRV